MFILLVPGDCQEQESTPNTATEAQCPTTTPVAQCPTTTTVAQCPTTTTFAQCPTTTTVALGSLFGLALVAIAAIIAMVIVCTLYKKIKGKYLLLLL